MDKINREDIEYALATCGCLYYEDGKTYYEENELLERLDDLFFNNPDADSLHAEISEEDFKNEVTNQQKLCELSAEEFLERIKWLIFQYGKQFTYSDISIIEWLKSKVDEA